MDKTKVENFRSNGKLLLTGEYLVLDGALALALPTRFGQSMTVSSSKTTQSNGVLEWESLDEKGGIWFKGVYALPDFDILSFFGSEPVAVYSKKYTFTSSPISTGFFAPSIIGEGSNRFGISERLGFGKQFDNDQQYR